MIIDLHDPLKLSRLGIAFYRKSHDFIPSSKFPFAEVLFSIEVNHGFGWRKFNHFKSRKKRDWAFDELMSSDHNLSTFQIL